MKTVQRISIVGLGYVGLTTAATLASKGFQVTGIEADQSKAEHIQKGIVPLQEPNLAKLVKSAIRNKRFHASSDIAAAAETKITFLAVGTPSQHDGSIDLSFIKAATRHLGKALSAKTNHLTVVKSTVVPGTTDGVIKPLLEESSGKAVGQEFGLCVNPEFLREGTAVQDSLHPDVIVIGSNDDKSATTLKRLWASFHRSSLPPVVTVSPETAELVKYTSNAFLANRVSLINTIANIAETIPGVDVNKVAEAIGHIPRIGPLFLKAGPGYGGSCFHKDLQALISYSQARGYDPILLRSTEEANERQADKVVQLSEGTLGGIEDKRFAVLGIAFKKDTDDIREAASLRVIHRLLKRNGRVVVYDPMAIANGKKALGDSVTYATSPRAALEGSDCCIVMTEWDEFQKLRPKDFQELMKTPNVVDARRILDPNQFSKLNYVGIGLGKPLVKLHQDA